MSRTMQEMQSISILHNTHFFLGNLTAGNFTEKTDLKGLRQCVMACCLADSCNIVFIVESRCFHVKCVSDELCLPLPRVGERKWDTHVSMILVKPVLPNGKCMYVCILQTKISLSFY